MANSVHDWVVKVGWDASDVRDGHKKINKLMSKMERMQTQGSRAASSSLSKQEQAQRRINTLESRRLAARERLFRLERSGGTANEIRTFRNRINASKTTTKLDEISRNIRERILAIRKQEEATAKATADREVKAAQKVAQVKSVHPSTIRSRMIDTDALGGKMAQASALPLPNNELAKMQLQNLDRLQNKLGQLQTRLQAIKSPDELKHWRNDMKELNMQARNTISTLKSMSREMTAKRFATEKLSASIKHLASNYLSVFAAVEGGRRFMAMGMEFESFDAMMAGVSDTAEEAAANFSFISNQALRLGADLRESTRAFASFGTAAKLSGFEMDRTSDMFTKVLEVNRAFGLSAERQGYVFLALEQMLGRTAKKFLRPLPPHTAMCVETLI